MTISTPSIKLRCPSISVQDKHECDVFRIDVQLRFKRATNQHVCVGHVKGYRNGPEQKQLFRHYAAI
jgi:hypothetical protein